MKLDLEKLTLGEIAAVERLAEAPITELFEDATPKGNALAALAMVHARRNGRPDFTFKQAQALTFTEAQELLGLVDAEPATPVAPAPELPALAHAPAPGSDVAGDVMAATYGYGAPAPGQLPPAAYGEPAPAADPFAKPGWPA